MTLLLLLKLLPRPGISRMALKQNRLLHSTILKRLLTRSHQTRSLRLRLLSKLLKPALFLSNGVASHLTAVVVNAQQRMPGNFSRRGSSYEVVVQIITSQQYYPPLLGLAGSTRMGILKYDADKANQIEASQVEYTPAPPPPPGE